ncbi:MAG: hypothetical protein ABIH87_03785 [bacterium]
MKLIIGYLYPNLLNLYGDRGNIECIVQRCAWRDIEVEVKPISIDTQLTDELVNQISLIFMGGGEDHSQKQLYNDFVNVKGKLIRRYIEDNGVGLFICGGYQLLGSYYQPYKGEKIKGLNILDIDTRHFGRDKKRCVGNVNCKIIGIQYLKNKNLVGFENHGGRTYLQTETQALGTTITGNGNNDQDKTEGVFYKNTIGTYLHGPLLPKNPHLADYLIKIALEKKYKQDIELKTLDDELEWKAHKHAIELEK